MKRAAILVVVVIAAALVGDLVWRAVSTDGPSTLTGYIEGEALYFAAPSSGSLVRLDVDRGDRVEKGAPLFAVDPAALDAQRDQAEASLAEAEAKLADVRKGERPIELAVIEAQQANAQATLDQAKATLDRTKPLVERGVSPKSALDDAQAAYDAALARRHEVDKSLEAARQGARDDQIRAAEAEVRRARAALKEVEVRLAELAPTAPEAARVEDVFYRTGEWVAANQPVVSLLPDERVRLRFFVPEGAVATYEPGRTVRFSCDGCGAPMTATVDYVSPRAEYTPPVIYSRSSRDKLVFMVEARPEAPAGLLPGLPVDVVPLEPRE